MGDPQAQDSPHPPYPGREDVERFGWVIRLRWWVGAGFTIAAVAAWWGSGIDLAWAAFAVGPGILAYNTAFYFALRSRRRGGPWASRFSPPIHAQMILDLVALTTILHLTGGLASPLLPLFVLYAVLSTLLLRRRDAYLHAALAVGLVSSAILMADAGWLATPAGLPWVTHETGVLWKLGAFGLTQFVAVWLGEGIAGALQAKEERLDRVQRDLSEAYGRLEEMDNARAQFVLTLTHELRSPVAAIESLLKVLPFAGEMPPKAKELAERANQRVAALLQLVNDLLDVAKERHEYGPKKMQPVDLRQVLRKACAACRDRADAKSITLGFEDSGADVDSPGDPEEIERLFLNLVGNAVNYTNPGGRVGVRLDVSRDPPPGEARIVIQDNGIGIPRESLQRLFEEFYRAPNAKRLISSGTGLGLAICKRIVASHGGRIEVASEEDVGSTFTVLLPLAQTTGDGKLPEG